MKKVFAGMLIGGVIGVVATWLALHQGAAGAAKPGESAPALEISTGSAAITKQLAAIDLTVASPETVSFLPEVKGYGRVLDPSPLVAALAEIESAKATAVASGKEFDRVQKLHADNGNASAQAVELADAAMQRDRTQLAAAQGRVLAVWGRALAQQSDLPALVRAVASGESALVRIDLLPGDVPAQAPAVAHVGSLVSESASHEVEVIGPAPSADPQVQGAGYLALWRAEPLPPGTVLRATLAAPGEAQKVLTVPRSALVRHEGGVFIYVQTAEGGFERRLVTLGPALPSGIVITSGVEEKDKVVVTGAQQLLATELLGAAGGGDEG